MGLMVEIGDVEPWERPDGILGEPILNRQGQPVLAWFILRSAPQKEVAACARLRVLGVPEAWFPTETVQWKPRGATAMQERQRRIAPGYLFTAWDREPRWHLLKDRSRGTITGVVSIGEEPWSIPEATMAKMAQVPERIEALRREEEARREAERLAALAARVASLPQVGQPARLLAGPLAGQVVMVDEVRGAQAAWTLAGIKGVAAVLDLEKVA